MNIGLFLGAGASTLYDMPTTTTIMDEIRNTFSDPHSQYILNSFENKDLEVIYQELLKIIKLLSTITQNKLLINTYIKYNSINISLNEFLRLLESLSNNILHLMHQKYYLDKDYDSKLPSSIFKKLVDFCLDNTKDLDIFTTNYDNSVSSFCKDYQNDYRFCDGFVPYDKFQDMVFNEEHLNDALPNESKAIIRLFKLHGSVDWYTQQMNGEEYLVKTYDPESYVGEFTAPTLIDKEPTNYPMTVLNKLFTKKFPRYDLCVIIGTSFRDQHINKIIKQRIADKKLTVLISPTILHDYAKYALEKRSDNDEYLSETTQNELKKTSKSIEIKFDAENIDELLMRIREFIELNKIENLDKSNTR